MNVKGRTFRQKLRVFKRLLRRRGVKYLLDFSLARLFRKFYQKPKVLPFPEITNEVILNIRQKVTYEDFSDPHTEQSLEFVRKFAPDYILVAGAPILKSSLYGLAKHLSINRHLGISPLYRGSDCPIWAMYNNDFENIGFTIHVLAKKADAGDILLQRRISIDHTFDLSQSLAFISYEGSKGFIEVLEKIITGVNMDHIRQKKGGKHYPPATLSAIRIAHKNHAKYIKHKIEFQ